MSGTAPMPIAYDFTGTSETRLLELAREDAACACACAADARAAAEQAVRVLELAGDGRDRRITELIEALREATTALICSAHRQAYGQDAIDRLGRRKAADAAFGPVTRQRGRHRTRGSRRGPGERDVPLFPVPDPGSDGKGWHGLGIAAFLGLAARSWKSLPALAHHLIIGTASVTVAAGMVAGGVTLAHSGGHAARAGATAGQVTSGAGAGGSAELIPSQRQHLDFDVMKGAAKGKHGKSGTTASSSSPIYPPYAPPSSPPSSGAPQSSQPPSPQQPGTLTVDNATIDLTTATSATITLGTSGGPVAWTATSVSPDITLDHSSGKIWAGESYKITVSLAASQDGQQVATFILSDASGTSYTVTVNLPAPAPAVSPSP